MKNILFVISSLSAGGRERQFIQLLKSLSEGSYSFRLSVIVMNTNVFFEEIEHLNLEKLIIEDVNIRSFECYRFLRKELQKKSYDILYAADEYVAIHSLLAAFFTKTKVVNASLRHGNVDFKNPRQLLRNITYRFSKYIIANSRFGYKGNHLMISKNRFVLYNGIDDSFVSKNLKVLVPQSQLKLISVSRLHPIKDYNTVLDALASLKGKGFSNFHYSIVGDGSEYDHISKKIVEKQLTNQVEMLGRRKDVQKLLLDADVLIHSSASEGCPNVVLEAMFSNTLVVATNTGGTPELIKDDCGYLFEYRNIIGLCDILVNILNHRHEIQKMTRTANAYVRNTYTTKMLASNFIDIVNKIIYE